MSETDVGREIDQRRRLGRLARTGELVALGAAMLVGLYCLTLWWNPAGLSERLLALVPGASPSGAALLVAYGLSLVPAFAFVLMMLEARGLFRSLGRGRLLDPDVPQRLTRLGILAFVTALASFFVRTATVLVLTWEGPQRQLAISIGSDEFSSLIAGLLFLPFALVMGEAVRIEDENRSIV